MGTIILIFSRRKNDETEQIVIGALSWSRREGTGGSWTQVLGLALERSRVVIQAPGRKGGVWEQVLQGRQTWPVATTDVPAEGFHPPSEGQRSSL